MAANQRRFSGKGFSELAHLRSIGLWFDPNAGEARAACISFPPLPDRFSVSLLDSASRPIPWHPGFEAKFRARINSGDLNELRRVRHQVAAELCRELLGSLSDGIDDVLVIGCSGMGIWQIDSDQRSYLELCNSSALAEEFGKTIVDDLPSRDLAVGGPGGPIEPHGFWMLLGDRFAGPGNHWRGLVDLGEQATRFSMIPPLKEQFRRDATFSYDVCVGQRLCAELFTRSQGSHGGKEESVSEPNGDYFSMAKSGTVIPSLVQQWRSVSAQRDRIWSPLGISPLPLLYVLDESEHRNAKIEDLMATGVQFIAEEISHYVRHSVSPSHPVGELFVISDHDDNPIAQLIQRIVPEIHVRRRDGFGNRRSLSAAAVAALAMMSVWQTPISLCGTTDVPRVLGRITPGSPSNWRKVLHEMSTEAPWLLPLREAV